MQTIIDIFTYELPIIEVSLFQLILIALWLFGSFWLYGKIISRIDKRQKEKEWKKKKN